MQNLKAAAAGTLCVLLATAGLATGPDTQLTVGAMRDLDFGPVTPTTGVLARETPLCVAMTAPGGYRVIAQGSGDAGAFALTGGLAPLPYRVRFSGDRGGRGRELLAGEVSAGFAGRPSDRAGGCNRLNARLTVLIGGPGLEASASGRYRGTLLLTVSPQ